jgi:hypothetical protein
VFLCFWMLSWPIVEKSVERSQNMTKFVCILRVFGLLTFG